MKDSSTGSVISSEKGGELIVEALVSWSEEVRQAKRLARELRQDADQGADHSDDDPPKRSGFASDHRGEPPPGAPRPRRGAGLSAPRT